MARYSNNEKARLLSEYESSLESKVDFCKRNKIGPTTLYRWQMHNNQTKSEPVRLLPVVSPEQKREEVVELMMPKGMSLRFSQDVSARYVADIIKAIAW